MEKVVIVGGARTPIGRYGGTLRDVPVYRLAALALNEAVKRAGIEPEQSDYQDGCSDQELEVGAELGIAPVRKAVVCDCPPVQGEVRSAQDHADDDRQLHGTTVEGSDGVSVRRKASSCDGR